MMKKPNATLARERLERACQSEASRDLPPGPVDDLDVLTVVYGQDTKRAEAVAFAFAEWDRVQQEMPLVLCAWCYREGNEPLALADAHKYPWLHLVRLPQYDVDDGIFRKEGLLNCLLREFSTARFKCCIDADVSSGSPLYFARVRAKLAGNPLAVFQGFSTWADTEEGEGQPSWSSQVLPGRDTARCVQPGMCWCFTQDWVDLHGGESVFNPWLITGSGDCMFILEHWDDRRGRVFAERHAQYAYFRTVRRVGLPSAKLDCLDERLVHWNHTVREEVPPEYRGVWFCNRAYRWSRWWLEAVGGIGNHVRLDENGVPMPIDPDGPFVRTAKRKPEMQSYELAKRVVEEEFGPIPVTATYNEYAYLARQDRYYAEFDRWRWNYAPIIDLMHGMPLSVMRSVLEVGPYRFPLVHHAERMDCKDHGVPRTTVHDADRRPWPFADRQFSLVLMSHVLEHLRNPAGAMAEAERVADVAIVAIPFRWEDGPDGHVGLDETTVDQWTRGLSGHRECTSITGPVGRQQYAMVWRFR